MADEKSLDYNKSSNETFQMSKKSEEKTTDNTKTTEDEPIENKYNEFTHYWSPEDEKMVMSSDTPTVRIFISHEIVPDEELEDVMEVDEAAAKSYNRKAFNTLNKLDKSKNAIVRVNNKDVVAHKSIDTDIDSKLKSLRGH